MPTYIFPTKYLLETDTDHAFPVSLESVLEIYVAKEFLTASVHTLKDCFHAMYWDTMGGCRRKKTFSIKQFGEKEARSAAEEFISNLPSIPEDFSVSKSVKDILQMKATARHMLRIAHPSQYYPSLRVPLDPYILGTWLGDGTTGQPELTNIDTQVLSYWSQWAVTNNLVMKKKSKNSIIHYRVNAQNKSRNTLTAVLRNMQIMKVKRIPDIYKYNSREVRMELVAGLIDTDGCVNGKGYDFIQCLKHENLFDDLREVVQSLGMKMSKTHCLKTCTSKGESKTFPAIRGNIIGPKVHEIPVKVNYKKLEKKVKETHLMKFTLSPCQ
jgi:hypothetical protein